MSAKIADRTADDPAAISRWGLRGDYSESLIVPVHLARYENGRLPGTSERVVHLVCLEPGEPHGRSPDALCGRLPSLLEVMPVVVGAGMPCEPCLIRHVVLGAPRRRYTERLRPRWITACYWRAT